MTDRLPPLPSLRAMVTQLKMMHAAVLHPDGGPEYVGLYLQRAIPDAQLRRWQAHFAGYELGEIGPFGRELVGVPSFDATAAARRLLAAARDAGHR